MIKQRQGDNKEELAAASGFDTLSRLVLSLAMLVVGTTSFVLYEKRPSFSYLGFWMATIGQVWLLFRGPSDSHSFWIFRQMSWTFNVIITLTFWGYLYRLEYLQIIFRDSALTHGLMALLHSLPYLAEVREILCHGIKYLRWDFGYTVATLVGYGVVNYVDDQIAGKPMYPMLTWQGASTLVFVAITLGIAFAIHSLGNFISSRGVFAGNTEDKKEK